MKISELGRLAHLNAISKGWWGEPGADGVLEERNFGELMMLAVGELSEALESWRDGYEPYQIFFKVVRKPDSLPIHFVTAPDGVLWACSGWNEQPAFDPEDPSWSWINMDLSQEHNRRILEEWGYDVKPEGPAVEIADTVIRLADTWTAYGIDMEEVIRIKMAYNTKRLHRHGGKRA